MKTSNIAKTTLLLGGLTGLFMLIGSALGGTGGMIIALVIAVAMNMGAWWFSGSMALRMSGAQEVTAEEAPELYNMVAELVERANMPMPKVCIIDTPMPNAFATGRNPQNGAVAVTTGIMSILDRDELAGVVAHELAHIKNYDTLISSIAASVAGAITFIADMAIWAMIFGGFGGDDEEGDGLADMVGGVLMLFLAPIAALIVQMAISRTREFGADAGGADILGNPEPLASALEKLEGWKHSAAPDAMGDVSPATSHLYITPPTLGNFAALFSTHPPTEKRIAKLREYQPQREPVAV